MPRAWFAFRSGFTALVAPTKIAISLPAVDLTAVPTISDVVAAPAEPVRATAIPPGGSVTNSNGDVDGSRGKGLGSGNSGRA